MICATSCRDSVERPKTNCCTSVAEANLEMRCCESIEMSQRKGIHPPIRLPPVKFDDGREDTFAVLCVCVDVFESHIWTHEQAHIRKTYAFKTRQLRLPGIQERRHPACALQRVGGNMPADRGTPRQRVRARRNSYRIIRRKILVPRKGYPSSQLGSLQQAACPPALLLFIIEKAGHM